VVNQENMIVLCPHCGARNRVPVNRLGEKPVCGKCRRSLTTGGKPEAPVRMTVVTDHTFPKEVVGRPGTVMVAFWASWCSACQALLPILEQMAPRYGGRVKFARLNVDQNRATSSRYEVMSLPTLILFRNGREVNRLSGAVPMSEVDRFLQVG